jgi:hypothetical protein
MLFLVELQALSCNFGPAIGVNRAQSDLSIDKSFAYHCYLLKNYPAPTLTGTESQ